ncbi:Zn-ribbon domain-containing OB-fold protein [Nocardia carnea]|uniref:Zn-ribbon domain-containing OB-fold protein n=1 Tax=Nocardia carnea TaxID=37328 RepID=UPI0024549807|nr:zinc ribbon domain-containing protein [Nocardia carnea]
MTAGIEATVSPIVDDLASDNPIGSFPEGPRLVGTRCDACGNTMVGTRVVCSACVGREVSVVALPDTGSLYSFTRLHVGSEGVSAIGYIDLPGDVRTLADIRENGTPLRPDLPVCLVVDGDGWFFTPQDDHGEEAPHDR